MKQRFSSLDVKVLVSELRASLLTLRISQIYDLSSRIFLLKFHKPNQKHILVVDSGFRCHLTQFARTTAAAPSAFVARLRKYLKTRRVTDIRQVGTDRVIEFVLSDGAYRLFLEFYAGGNVILTDAELNILACLRIVSVEEGEEVRVGIKYMLERRQNVNGVPDVTEPRVKAGLEAAIEKAKKDEEPGKKSKKRKVKQGDALRKALAVSLNELPPPLLEHAFLEKQFDATQPIEEVLTNERAMKGLMDVLHFARELVDHVGSEPMVKGYIVAKIAKPKAGSSIDGEDLDKENLNLMYEDFQPFRPKQFDNDPNVQILEYDGFNATVDEFFSSIESQKLESRLQEREDQAKRKLEAAKQDHERRLGGLQQVQELNVRKAQAIEANLQRVQETTDAVNGLIAQGMDWVDIAKLIQNEQARHNPVAEIIKLPLKLYENTVTLTLHEAEDDFEDEGYDTDSEPEDTDEEEAEPKKPDHSNQALEVDIDLALSPWSNARQYYDQKRTAATKEQKTMQASEKALKSTERKIAADLKKGLKEEKEVLRPVRKQFWFEKFFYFISSEGYLVLAGKDMQQNEILYKRYLSKGDVYVHADLNGAASVIVKNKPGLRDSEIPLYTLAQAGNFCVATSSAWDSKAVMAAWWVNADQVSKTASTGDYLDPGLFAVKGQKNFLPPAQLLLGFGVMFQVSETSKARHNKNRVKDIRAAPGADNAGSNAPVGAVSLDAEHKSDAVLDENEDDDHEDDDSDAASDHGSHSDVENEREAYHNPLQSVNRDTSKELLETDEPAEARDDNLESDLNSDDDLDAKDGAAQPEASDADADGAEDVETEDVAEHGTSLTDQHDTKDSASTMSKTKAAPQVRGKHGKKAKMKTKYAHQDEEDRALALRLLGSKAGQDKVQSDAEKKVTKEQEAQQAKERRRQQHIQTQTAGKEAEQKRRQQMDQGLEAMDPEELAELEQLDALVGTPLPGDEILDALVVCAPWDALGSRLKWRVKLQPGAQKKGKAVREILDFWNRHITEREKKRMPDANDERFAEEQTARKEGGLIKGLRDIEVVGVVPVMKLRTMIAGGNASGGDKGKGSKGNAKGGGRGGKGSKRR